MQGLQAGKVFEQQVASRLGWAAPERGGVAGDLISPDGRIRAHVKRGNLGARDLHAAVVELGLAADRWPDERLLLVADLERMGPERLEKEWSRALTVLRRDLSPRLGLVARASGRWLNLPEGDRTLEDVALALRKGLPDVAPSRVTPGRGSGWTPPRQEVFKALLDAWLGCEPALQVQALARRVGCSVPTVNEVMVMLQTSGELERTPNRSVSFSGLPRKALNEVLATSRHVRDRARFVDRSGRPPDAAGLLKRLQRLAPENVAVGGVVAARRYDPGFDLNGLPRLDVTALAGDELAWVRRLDPALKPLGPSDGAREGPVLVVHTLFRPALPPTSVEGSLPLADRAETLLDLYDMGLGEQAADLVRLFRRGGETR